MDGNGESATHQESAAAAADKQTPPVATQRHSQLAQVTDIVGVGNRQGGVAAASSSAVHGVAAADLQKANEKLMEIQQLNQLLEIVRAAPNWSTTLDKLSLVPSRASEIRDHGVMQDLHTQQTRYLQLLREKLGIYWKMKMRQMQITRPPSS